jgi:hypothetical protein
MSKNKSAKNLKSVDNTETEPKAKGEKGTRAIMLTVNGEQVKRLDYIREQWAAKVSRADIAKAVSELQGKTIPYQIVFAATKGIEGGPDRVAKEPKAKKAKAEASQEDAA